MKNPTPIKTHTTMVVLTAVIFLLVALAATQARADVDVTVKKDAPFCFSKQLLMTLSIAVVAEDWAKIDTLDGNGCYMTTRELDAEVIGKGQGYVVLKVYQGDVWMELYTWPGMLKDRAPKRRL